MAVLDQRGELDWSIALLDGPFVRAKKGEEKVGLPEGIGGSDRYRFLNSIGLASG
jgi:hypothetical protein